MGRLSRARIQRREAGRRLGIAMQKYPQLKPPELPSLRKTSPYPLAAALLWALVATAAVVRFLWLRR